MADDAITWGGRGVLVSPVYILPEVYNIYRITVHFYDFFFLISSTAVPYIPPVVQVKPRSTDSVSVTWTKVEGFYDYNIKYKLRYNTTFSPEWILFKEVSPISHLVVAPTSKFC